jgi:glutamate-ammonia-ligase adenylyltransferase
MATAPRAGDLATALARLGYAQPADAARHLESVMLGRDGIARVAKACANAADPDLAVAQLCRWIAMAGQVPGPQGLARLAAVLGLSTSLGAFLARHPEQAKVLIEARLAGKPRTRQALAHEAARVVVRSDNPSAALRLWKRRELLRIAGRDLAGLAPVEEVARELSWLAEAAVGAALESLIAEQPAPRDGAFAVIGMGKLGGEELNYASDIDLLFVYDGADDPAAREWSQRIAEGLIQRLAATTLLGIEIYIFFKSI